jgi:hypothetical protein
MHLIVASNVGDGKHSVLNDGDGVGLGPRRSVAPFSSLRFIDGYGQRRHGEPPVHQFLLLLRVTIRQETARSGSGRRLAKNPQEPARVSISKSSRRVRTRGFRSISLVFPKTLKHVLADRSPLYGQIEPGLCGPAFRVIARKTQMPY